MTVANILKRCRKCRLLKPTDGDGKVIGHDRWSYDHGEFVPCDGSGRLPEYARVDTVRTRGLL